MSAHRLSIATLLRLQSNGNNLTYRATYDEDPFLFSPHPLYDPIGALRQCLSPCARARDSIKLEKRRNPGQGRKVPANAMVDFEMRYLCMHCRVQGVV